MCVFERAAKVCTGGWLSLEAVLMARASPFDARCSLTALCASIARMVPGLRLAALAQTPARQTSELGFGKQ